METFVCARFRNLAVFNALFSGADARRICTAQFFNDLSLLDNGEVVVETVFSDGRVFADILVHVSQVMLDGRVSAKDFRLSSRDIHRGRNGESVRSGAIVRFGAY